MFMQPTIEKLYAMKLIGMADALSQQMSDPGTSQLSFEERFSLLVDQQWTWKQNKALACRLRNSKLAAARRRISIGVNRAGWIAPKCAVDHCDWVRQHHNLSSAVPLA
jgi:hypothetical protein